MSSAAGTVGWRRSSHCEKSRDGFQRGVVTGLIGMALAAFSNGRFSLGSPPAKPGERLVSPADFYRGKLTPQEITAVQQECDVRVPPLMVR